MVEKSHTTGFWPSIYDPLRSMRGRVAEWLAPASEASADEDAYRIAVELPGVKDEDIELNVHDGVVTLKGEKRTEREETGDTWYFSERHYGSFNRSFRLPPDADAAGVDAHLKDGILTVTIPKMKKSAEPDAKVTIRTS